MKIERSAISDLDTLTIGGQCYQYHVDTNYLGRWTYSGKDYALLASSITTLTQITLKPTTFTTPFSVYVTSISISPSFQQVVIDYTAIIKQDFDEQLTSLSFAAPLVINTPVLFKQGVAFNELINAYNASLKLSSGDTKIDNEYGPFTITCQTLTNSIKTTFKRNNITDSTIKFLICDNNGLLFIIQHDAEYSTTTHPRPWYVISSL